MNIEIIYATSTQIYIKQCQFNSSCTVQQALTQSGFLQEHTLDFTVNKVGIWGAVVSMEQMLIDGDRIEIYRPLINDPKEIRQRRALKK